MRFLLKVNISFKIWPSYIVIEDWNPYNRKNKRNRIWRSSASGKAFQLFCAASIKDYRRRSAQKSYIQNWCGKSYDKIIWIIFIFETIPFFTSTFHNETRIREWIISYELKSLKVNYVRWSTKNFKIRK